MYEKAPRNFIIINFANIFLYGSLNNHCNGEKPFKLRDLDRKHWKDILISDLSRQYS